MKQASFEVPGLAYRRPTTEVRHSFSTAIIWRPWLPYHECFVEMTQGRGEHASRRFHFVREEHTDPLLACKRNAGQPALSACESDLLMLLTRREVCDCRWTLSRWETRLHRRFSESGRNASLAYAHWQIAFAVEAVSALPAAVDEMHPSEILTSKIDWNDDKRRWRAATRKISNWRNCWTTRNPASTFVSRNATPGPLNPVRRTRDVGHREVPHARIV